MVHPFGALALAVGLTLSFTGIGLFVATLGFAIGLDAEWFRSVAALLLIGFGTVMLIPWLQQRFAMVTAPFGTFGEGWLRKFQLQGLGGQMLVGLLLGLVWAPCVGPTLGAAATLASQGRNLGQIAVLMLIFGIGAAAPLVLLGSLSRVSLMKVRGRMLSVGHYGKQVIGLIMVGLGIVIVTGTDKSLEAWILDRSPQWLTVLTTRY